MILKKGTPLSWRSMLKTDYSQVNKLVLVVGIFINVHSVSVQAKDVIAHNKNGAINWSTGIITAKGYGIPPSKFVDTPRGALLARRAAIVDTYRNLAEITYGVRVTSSATVKGLVELKRITKTRVSAVIKGAQVTSESFEDGKVKVTMSLKMGSRFMSTIMPENHFREFSISNEVSSLVFIDTLMSMAIPAAYASTLSGIEINTEKQLEWFKQLKQWSKGKKGSDITQEIDDAISKYEEATSYTGVVIDARNVPQLEWATHVKLVNPDGKALYPNSKTDYGSISRNRLTSFEYDLDAAMKKVRVAAKPMVIKAKSIYRKRFSDLLLSKDDASRIQKLSSSSASSLNRGRVIIVVSE